MDLDINKIKELIKDNYLKQHFTQQLELIQVVDFNYEHIVQLEQLIKVMKSGLSDYYKEYHPEQHFLTTQAGIIAENTRANHYKKESEKLPDAHSLFKEVIGKESVIINFKSNYYKSKN